MKFAKSRTISAPLAHMTARRLGPAIAALAMAVLGPTGACRAGGWSSRHRRLITAAPGSSGSFLVLIGDTDPAGSPGYNVAGDSFELQATGPAGLRFTGVSIATGASALHFCGLHGRAGPSRSPPTPSRRPTSPRRISASRRAAIRGTRP